MKKEYISPSLKEWGNVKDLTLGGPNGVTMDENSRKVGFNNRNSNAI